MSEGGGLSKLLHSDCVVLRLGLVNKQNTSYQFENILKYCYGFIQKSNIEILEPRYQLQYRFKMVLLASRL